VPWLRGVTIWETTGASSLLKAAATSDSSTRLLPIALTTRDRTDTGRTQPHTGRVLTPSCRYKRQKSLLSQFCIADERGRNVPVVETSPNNLTTSNITDQQHHHHGLATEPPARRPVEDMKAARNSARPVEKAAAKAARFAGHCGSPTLQYFEHRPDQSVDDGLGAIFFARSDVANRLISVCAPAPCHQSDLNTSLTACRHARRFFRSLCLGCATGRHLPGIALDSKHPCLRVLQSVRLPRLVGPTFSVLSIWSRISHHTGQYCTAIGSTTGS
jgi:hypothetical protein